MQGSVTPDKSLKGIRKEASDVHSGVLVLHNCQLLNLSSPICLSWSEIIQEACHISLTEKRDPP